MPSLHRKSSRRSFLASISRFYSTKSVAPAPAPIQSLETPVSSTPLIKAVAQNPSLSSQQETERLTKDITPVETAAVILDNGDTSQRQAALLDGLSTAATVLDNLSSLIPFPPAASLIAVSLKIISLFKNAAHVRIECLDLCNRIATYVLLVVEEVKDQDTPSPQLLGDLNSFQTVLNGLYSKLTKDIPSDQNAMIAAINSGAHAGVIQSCEVELQRQIERFQVLRSIHDGKVLFKTLVQTREIFKLSSEANQRLRRIDYKLEVGLEELKTLLQRGRAPQKGSAEVMPPTTNLLGCDVFITQVVGSLKNGISVCMLGAEGAGKTSIAVQIMNDRRITSTFTDANRFWVPCSRANTFRKFEDLLCSQVHTNSKLGHANRFMGLQRALSVLPGRKLILLDDFENVWNAARPECRKALEALTNNTNVIVLITMKSQSSSQQNTFDDAFSPCVTLVIPSLKPQVAKQLFGSYYALKDTDEEKASLNVILEKLAGRPSLIKLMAIRAVNSSIADIKDMVQQIDASGDPASFIIKDSLVRLQHVPNAQRILNTLGLFPSGLQQGQLDTWLSFRNSEALGYLRGIGLVFYNSGNDRWFLSPLIRSYLPATDRIATSARKDAHDRVLQILQEHSEIRKGPVSQDSFKRDMEDLSKHEPGLTEIVVDMMDMLNQESNAKEANKGKQKGGKGEVAGKNRTTQGTAEEEADDGSPETPLDDQGDGNPSQQDDSDVVAGKTKVLEALLVFCVYQRWSRANRDVAEAAVRLADQWKSPMLAELRDLLGAIHIQLDQYQDAYTQFNLAAKTFKSNKDFLGMVRSSTRSMKAQCSRYQGKTNDSLLLSADKLAHDVGLPTTYTLQQAKTEYPLNDNSNDVASPKDLDLLLQLKAGSEADQDPFRRAEMLARIQVGKAHLYRCGRKGPECLDRVEVALYLAKDVLKNTTLTIDCQYLRARALALTGRYMDALQELDRVIAFYEDFGIEGKGIESGAYVYNAKTRALKGAQQWGPVLFEAAQRAVTMCQTYGSPFAAGDALVEYGELFIRKEKWKEAALIYEEALKEYQRVGTEFDPAQTEACTMNLLYARVKEDLPNIKFVVPLRA
ncbi:hypothetical protein CVT24_000598 [Panaeolus cyanescens]|uniref:NACHT domain-containing protein n=1 Tax=Panaeolus cyanescens TaxID=181874 RepID=A0A409YDH4_9AGAR|nr:hypothetical protein CVT24_000598 [Panaeolus cyanescens]